MITEAGEDEECVVEVVCVAVDDHREQNNGQCCCQNEGNVGKAV